MTDVWEGRKRDNLYWNEREGSFVARATKGIFKSLKKKKKIGLLGVKEKDVVGVRPRLEVGGQGLGNKKTDEIKRQL